MEIEIKNQALLVLPFTIEEDLESNIWFRMYVYNGAWKYDGEYFDKL
jgi:hypothetical protein